MLELGIFFISSNSFFTFSTAVFVSTKSLEVCANLWLESEISFDVVFKISFLIKFVISLVYLSDPSDMLLRIQRGNLRA
jgi:hypothetical protein